MKLHETFVESSIYFDRCNQINVDENAILEYFVRYESF